MGTIEAFLVFTGGAAGSLTRYILGKLIAQKAKGNFPLGTFIINISGAFLLGVLSTLNPTKNVYLFAAEGFLGGYTTFSTFMYEGFTLISSNKRLNAFIYITCTVITGITGFFAGSLLTALFI